MLATTVAHGYGQIIRATDQAPLPLAPKWLLVLVGNSSRVARRLPFAWINTSNDNPRLYVWTKTADQNLASIANYCHRITSVAAAYDGALTRCLRARGDAVLRGPVPAGMHCGGPPAPSGRPDVFNR